MSNTMCVEPLTPLDLIMPRTYIRIMLAFSTEVGPSMNVSNLRQALAATVRQVPWLVGHVHTTTAPKPSLEIRWDSNAPAPEIKDLGQLSTSYEALAAENFPLSAIPEQTWPAPPYINDALLEAGAPVFAAGMLRFADGKGCGLCVCMHHHAVDANGFTEIIKLWSANMSAGIASDPVYLPRTDELIKALRSHPETASSQTVEDLLVAHPEYSLTPPSFPSSPPQCTAKIFAVPISRIEKYKELLAKDGLASVSTNTVLCALLWCAVTRARQQRDATLLPNDYAHLNLSVNVRQRMDSQFSIPDTPYYGNAVVSSVVKEPISDLVDCNANPTRHLNIICRSIIASITAEKVNAQYVAQVCSLVNKMRHYCELCLNWRPYGSHDLIITSWANLDLYNLDFGPELGKPQFVRPPNAEGDGICIVLPRRRKRLLENIEEVVEVMVMAQKADMLALEALQESDKLW